MIEMHQAGPMNFLRTLLIILLVYYVFKFLVKLFAPHLMRKAVEKMQKKYNKQYQASKKPDVKVGETVIDKKPNKKDGSNDSVGEYIDFEEID